MKLHVHIVTRRRAALFEQCLLTVRQSLPPNSVITVVVNGPDKATLDLLARPQYADLRWTAVAEEHRSLARNRALQMPLGEVLYFLDDDVLVPPTLFKDVLRRFEDDATLSVIGGPNLTPPGSSPREELFGEAMACPWIAPLAWRRYNGECSPHSGEAALILCNLAVRVRDIPRDVAFDDSLCSNEENLFLHELQRRGQRFLFDPKFFVYHRRRTSWVSFALQVGSYGQGRAEQMWIAGKSVSLLHLAPALACLYAGSMILTGQFRPVLIGGSSYALSIVFFDAWKNRILAPWKMRWRLIGAGTVIQSAYGLGFWKGFATGLGTRIAHYIGKIPGIFPVGVLRKQAR